MEVTDKRSELQKIFLGAKNSKEFLDLKSLF